MYQVSKFHYQFESVSFNQTVYFCLSAKRAKCSPPSPPEKHNPYRWMSSVNFILVLLTHLQQYSQYKGCENEIQISRENQFYAYLFAVDKWIVSFLLFTENIVDACSFSYGLWEVYHWGIDYVFFSQCVAATYYDF